MKKVFEIKNKFKEDSMNIIKRKEEADENDYELIKTIISRDNTEPDIVLAYLEMVRKFDNDEFLPEIQKYQYFLSDGMILKNFEKFYQKEVSASELFFNLWNKIKKFSTSYSSTEKMCFYLDLVNIETPYDNIKGIADYENTKELALYILVHNIKQGIIEQIKRINDYKVDENNDMIKALQKNINKISNKSKENSLKGSDIPNIQKEEENIQKMDKINEQEQNTLDDLREQIKLISRVESDSFNTYFENFGEFLSGIKKNFHKRFENINKLNKNDLELFMYLCFFDSLCFYFFISLFRRME